MANLGQSWDVHKIKRAALPEYHTYSIWRLGKKTPNRLMQLRRSEALFAHCAGREAGAKRITSRLDGGARKDVTRVPLD